MTVFQKIQGMTEQEFAGFIFAVYNKGWFDGVNGVDDEAVFGAYLLNQDEQYLDEVFEK